MSLTKLHEKIFSEAGAGTRLMSEGNFLLKIANIAAAHNCFLRGKELDLATLLANVRAENFADIYCGDYVVATTTVGTTTVTTKWRLAGFNYFVTRLSERETIKNNFALIPDDCIYTTQWHTSSTMVAYVNSALHKTALPLITTAIETTFGTDNMCPIYNYNGNAYKSTHLSGIGAGQKGITSSRSGYTCPSVIIPTPKMMGFPFQSSLYDLGETKGVLPLVRLCPRMSRASATYWTRSIANTTSALAIGATGGIDITTVTTTLGVRPIVILG